MLAAELTHRAESEAGDCLINVEIFIDINSTGDIMYIYDFFITAAKAEK